MRRVASAVLTFPCTAPRSSTPNPQKVTLFFHIFPRTNLTADLGQAVVLQLKDVLAKADTYGVAWATHPVHDGWVLGVKAGTVLGTFVSCCASDRAALAVHGADHQTAVFRINRGVYAFDHDPVLHVILTVDWGFFLVLHHPLY